MPLQRQINRSTGITRRTSGAATKNYNNLRRQMQNRYRRTSMGGKGG